MANTYQVARVRCRFRGSVPRVCVISAGLGTDRDGTRRSSVASRRVYSVSVGGWHRPPPRPVSGLAFNSRHPLSANRSWLAAAVPFITPLPPAPPPFPLTLRPPHTIHRQSTVRDSLLAALQVSSVSPNRSSRRQIGCTSGTAACHDASLTQPRSLLCR